MGNIQVNIEDRQQLGNYFQKRKILINHKVKFFNPDILIYAEISK